LSDIWESSAKEERRGLAHILMQEVGVDVTIKRVPWVKARPDYEPLFSILNGMGQDAGRRLWIDQQRRNRTIRRVDEYWRINLIL